MEFDQTKNDSYTAGLAKRVAAPSASESNAFPRHQGKDPSAVSLGRRGGLKGGRARADKLSAERRKEIAREAARARWSRRTAS